MERIPIIGMRQKTGRQSHVACGVARLPAARVVHVDIREDDVGKEKKMQAR